MKSLRTLVMFGFLLLASACGGIFEDENGRGGDGAGGRGAQTGVGGQASRPPQDSCEALCQSASECPGSTDFDLLGCNSGCRETLRDVEDQGCADSYNQFQECWDICDPNSFIERCESLYLAFTECMRSEE